MTKTQPLSLLLLLTLILGVSSYSFANNGSGFGRAVSDLETHCRSACDGTFRVEAIRNPSPQIRQRLQAWALEQGQLWGDTILEGDYYLKGPIQLRRADAIYRGSQLVAYRITYTAQAWFTGECNFNPQTKAGLNQCQQGFISESSFISPNLAEVANDNNHMATFIKNPGR